ncbi:MAG: M20 metallopeptidase family protein [Gemmatimonadales bacterium]
MLARNIALLAFTPLALLRAQDPALDRAIARVVPEITEIRHRIHQNPELGNREVETARLVAQYLRRLGFAVDTGIAYTGVVAVLRGRRPGPVVAVRADMDALPVTEATDFPFRSTKRGTYLGQEVGISHACGHDIHVAVQLGVASVLAGMKNELPGTVKFIFQPAEEGAPPGERGGARLMVEEGVLDNPRPSAVFGLHAAAALPVGKLGYTAGPALAASDHFRILVKGRQSHGATPELSVDPVVLAAQVVTALQTIRSRNLSPLEPSVVTVGIIRGGTRFNIIPGEVELQGTVRTFSAEAQNTVERRMREILAGITAAGGGAYELEYNRNVPVTINDVALTRRMAPTLARATGADNVVELPPWMPAEDFSYFANVVPGFYFRLGVVKAGTTSGDHHTPTFRADDSAIPVGIRAMANVLVDYLKGSAAR